MNFIKKSMALTLLVMAMAGTTAVMAQGTDFFGIPGNPPVDEGTLNGPDEQAAGQQNQGWDGGTGEVVPGDANTDVPPVSDPVPVDE